MVKKTSVLLFISFLGLFLLFQPCAGQGFSNDNQGTRSLGQANAFTARASDPSAIWFNPACITRLRGTHIYLGGSGFLNEPFFDSQEYGKTFYSDNGLLISPHAYISHQLSKNLWAGLGFSNPVRYLQNWGDDPANQAVRTSDTFKVNSYVISPCIAFKIGEKVSVGIGLHFLSSDIEVVLWDRQEIENLAQDKLGMTAVDYFLRSHYLLSGNGLVFFGGLQARLSDTIIFGLSYQGGKKMESEGTLDYEHQDTKYPDLDQLVREAFPDGTIINQGNTAVHQFTIGLALLLGSRFEIEINYNYKLWSSLEKWQFELSNPVIDEDLKYYGEGEISWNWQNCGSLRLGGEFHATDSLDLRAGLALSQSPVPAERLTLVVPDNSYTSIHLGLGYKINKFTIDLAYALRFYEERANQIPNWESYGIVVKKNQGSVFAISLGFEI